jgi:hypothetical protein
MRCKEEKGKQLLETESAVREWEDESESADCDSVRRESCRMSVPRRADLTKRHVVNCCIVFWIPGPYLPVKVAVIDCENSVQFGFSACARMVASR